MDTHDHIARDALPIAGGEPSALENEQDLPQVNFTRHIWMIILFYRQYCKKQTWISLDDQSVIVDRQLGRVILFSHLIFIHPFRTGNRKLIIWQL